MAVFTILVSALGFATANDPPNTAICSTSISGSSCVMSGCNAERGDTWCSQVSHVCLCKPGHCVNLDIETTGTPGVCVPDPRVPEQCHVDLQESCIFSCSKANSECDRTSGECTCSIGYCMDDSGECAESPMTCQKGTPGTCAILDCNSARGPTDCFSGVCFCAGDSCWSDQFQTCMPVTTLESMTVALSVAPNDNFFLLRRHGVKVKNVLARFGHSSMFLACLMIASAAVAVHRRRTTTVSVEPLLSGSGEAGF